MKCDDCPEGELVAAPPGAPRCALLVDSDQHIIRLILDAVSGMRKYLDDSNIAVGKFAAACTGHQQPWDVGECFKSLKAVLLSASSLDVAKNMPGTLALVRALIDRAVPPRAKLKPCSETERQSVLPQSKFFGF